VGERERERPSLFAGRGEGDRLRVAYPCAEAGGDSDTDAAADGLDGVEALMLKACVCAADQTSAKCAALRREVDYLYRPTSQPVSMEPSVVEQLLQQRSRSKVQTENAP